MSRFIGIAGMAALALFAVGSVGVAGASTSVGGSAQDTVSALQAEGYAVQLNGSVTGALSMCSVTGVHGLPIDPVTNAQKIRWTTVYVDLDCMSND